MADVGAQIHIRVLVPKRMKEAELVAFFETLHVKAMNASVVDNVEGLGDVPVIVLASALTDEDREAYLARKSAWIRSERPEVYPHPFVGQVGSDDGGTGSALSPARGHVPGPSWARGTVE